MNKISDDLLVYLLSPSVPRQSHPFPTWYNTQTLQIFLSHHQGWCTHHQKHTSITLELTNFNHMVAITVSVEQNTNCRCTERSNFYEIHALLIPDSCWSIQLSQNHLTFICLANTSYSCGETLTQSVWCYWLQSSQLTYWKK